MVGAVTTLIVILAVFLAYNANNGLPFVPSYRISVQVPNAETLVPGNDVRIGGVRVGFVEDVVPVQHKDGRVTAKADLKLDKNVDPIPVGSTVVVRAKSALGLKYLEINRTDSPNGYPEGSTLPLKAANPHPVEYDQVLSMFNGPTRTAVRQNLVEFGAVLAGRGPRSMPRSGSCVRCCADLEPVARNLASSRARDWPGSSARPGIPRRRSPPSPRLRPTCSSPSTPRSAPWRRSPGRSSRTRSPRPRRPSTP